MISVLLLILASIEFCHPLSSCNIKIVESIPQDLTYESTAYIADPIWKSWEDLIQSSKKYIRINSLYWTMNFKDANTTDHSSLIGSHIFWMLVNKSQTVPVFINNDISNSSCSDIKTLELKKNIHVYSINVSRLSGNGIQHSKLIIGDGSKAFVGSANMDWRSLTQIKEVGAYLTECSELIYDLDVFWVVINMLTGVNAKIPKVWPPNTWPKYNITNPFIAKVNGVPMKLYTATSPKIFNPPYRTDDLTALISTIDEAQSFILISVMDFSPLFVDFKNHHERYWPKIEEALITAAVNRKVSIRILISLWKHSFEENFIYLRALAELGKKTRHDYQPNIEVKVFIIPAFNDFQRNLPFSRVSHSKYMVTDSTAYIGTSNWSGNYFNGTVGLSLIAKDNCGKNKCGEKSIRMSLEMVFFTDWNSIYAHKLHDMLFF